MSLPSDPQQRWILILTALVSFMTALDAMVVTTALTTIRDELGASMVTLQWTVNAYNLSFAVFLMTGAALGERFGRRRVLLVGLLLFTLASAVCGLATGVVWLVAGRTLQGLGAALCTPVAMAILSAAFSGPQRAGALGIYASITGLALIVGPVLGSALTERLSWPWIFLLNIPVGAALMVLVRSKITESRGLPAPIDVRGALLMTLSALGLAWTLVRGHAVGWASTQVLAGLAAALAFGAAFLAGNHRSASSMMPPRLFAAPGLRASLAAAALMYAPLYGMLFLLPQLLQSQGGSVLQVGLRLLPWTATLFVVAPLAGKAVARFGERRVATLGLALQGLGILAVAGLAAQSTGYLPLVPALLLAGAGISMAMPAVQNTALSSVPPQDIGRASGVFNTVRFFAGFCGVALATEVFSRAGSLESSLALRAGLWPAFAVLGLLSMTGALFASRLPRGKFPREAGVTAALPARPLVKG